MAQDAEIGEDTSSQLGEDTKAEAVSERCYTKTTWNKAPHSETQLAQDLASSLWEGCQENNKLIFMFEDLAAGSGWVWRRRV